MIFKNNYSSQPAYYIKRHISLFNFNCLTLTQTNGFLFNDQNYVFSKCQSEFYWECINYFKVYLFTCTIYVYYIRYSLKFVFLGLLVFFPLSQIFAFVVTLCYGGSMVMGFKRWRKWPAEWTYICIYICIMMSACLTDKNNPTIQ